MAKIDEMLIACKAVRRGVKRGGPWLDGRLRMAGAAIGYAASNADSSAENYANVARHLRGQRPA